MATKNQLQQLLLEDQEPFHLHDYIAERRTKLRTSSTKNQLHLTRITKQLSDRPTSSNRDSSVTHFSVTFCKNACFKSKNGSPDLLNRASPVFNLPKSPVKLLQIPSKTAALLLEAALRIHKHSSSRKRANRFGTDFSFFGSVLKKLSVKTEKRHSIVEAALQMTSSEASGSGNVRRKSNPTQSESDVEFCFEGRRSDAVWSEDKSLDTVTSCSSSNSDSTRTVGEHTRSPSRCPSPDFSTRPPSPTRRAVKNLEADEKEQCSPVCVLDPQFEEDEHDHDPDDDVYGCQCSYAIVERKRQQLLDKLSRFDALADFDPKDLEKLIVEDELYNHPDLGLLDETDDIASEFPSDQSYDFFKQVLDKCGFQDHRKISIDMKRLVFDLIAEEQNQDEFKHEGVVVNTVCERLRSWNGAQQNTIDMMVEEDFRDGLRKWKTNEDELRFVAMDIELGIFTSLVREAFV